MSEIKRPNNPKSPPFPGITVRREGKICILKQTLEEYDLGDLDYVTLEYHPAESLLIITPSYEEVPPSHEVKREKDNTPVIQCQDFLDLIKFSYKDGPEKVFKANWDEFTGAILVKLSY
jgi:hypothetical protein